MFRSLLISSFLIVCAAKNCVGQKATKKRFEAALQLADSIKPKLNYLINGIYYEAKDSLRIDYAIKDFDLKHLTDVYIIKRGNALFPHLQNTLLILSFDSGQHTSKFLTNGKLLFKPKELETGNL